MGIPSHGDIDGEGNLAVPGQTLPSVCPTCKRKIVPKFSDEDSLKPRPRVSKTIKIPKDSQEDGVQILEDLIEQAREKLGRPEGTPPYFILVESLYGFLTT